MKPLFPLASIAVVLACLGSATDSLALTLGRAQGLALVGQPLELRFQLQTDASEDLQAACLSAEVFYGDSQVDPSRISLRLDANPNADAANPTATVRVRAATPVNEPVVTVNLRSGCQIRSSKRYTLLADLPTQVVEPPAAPAPPLTARVAAAPATTATAPTATGRLANSEREPGAATQAPVAPRAVAPRKPRTIAAPPVAEAPAVAPRLPKAVKPAKTGARARLKLDPLDLVMERDPVLRASDELLSPVREEGGTRRSEAAALWRALNATPEQILREEVQAQRAAEELKSLYTITNANQKGLMELVARVEKADAERYANGLVYTLIALCVLSMAALVWLWQRLRVRATPVADWRQGMEAGDSLMAELVEARSARRHGTPAPEATWGAQPAEPPPAPARVPTPTSPPAAPAHSARPVSPKAAPKAHVPLTEVDFDLDLVHAPENEEFRESMAADPWATPAAAAPSAWRNLEVPSLPITGHGPLKRVEPRGVEHHGGIDFMVSQSPLLRAIDTEELEDIRQQAEFFVSLGEHDKAVDILTTRVAQCGETSPLLCLDLLRLYHALGREAEYEFMRTEFQHWFTGRVPPFADFGNEGRSLDRYPQVMERITALWPGPPVLAFIEDCLYHHTGAVGGQDFDLQAYRDLLLLHTVAKRTIRMADDSGAADAPIPEGVRIPPRAQSALLGDVAVTASERRAPELRAGVQWRGATAPSDDDPDPQADIETRGAPLGSMRVPPSATARAQDPADAAANQDHLTDFNFLHLR